jgi:hypothetical protein
MYQLHGLFLGNYASVRIVFAAHSGPEPTRHFADVDVSRLADALHSRRRAHRTKVLLDDILSAGVGQTPDVPTYGFKQISVNPNIEGDIWLSRGSVDLRTCLYRE